MIVCELIKQLQGMPEDSDVGFYAENAYNRGDPAWLNFIKSIEIYDNPRCGHIKFGRSKKIVALIGGVA